jgi:uracil-DNA glycosylase
MSIAHLPSNTWQNSLTKVPFKLHMISIKDFIKKEVQKGKTIYPAKEHVFEAFNLCAWEEVKVVILGQDPYHNPGQANGLSFSVPEGMKIPPSLVNIFKEIKTDLRIQNDQGNLSAWAAQGVLLLNAILTVNENEPASHRKAGWEAFTDEVIQKLSREKCHLVFMLWGNFAQSKAKLIDGNKHLILEAAHPSPLSAYRGFFGCKHFSKANAYLKVHGLAEIEWKTPLR